jgi:hypothetical protein
MALCVEVLSWDFKGFDPLHEPLVNQFIAPPIAWRPLLIQVPHTTFPCFAPPIAWRPSPHTRAAHQLERESILLFAP